MSKLGHYRGGRFLTFELSMQDSDQLKKLHFTFHCRLSGIKRQMAALERLGKPTTTAPVLAALPGGRNCAVEWSFPTSFHFLAEVSNPHAPACIRPVPNRSLLASQ